MILTDSPQKKAQFISHGDRLFPFHPPIFTPLTDQKASLSVLLNFRHGVERKKTAAPPLQKADLCHSPLVQFFCFLEPLIERAQSSNQADGRLVF